MKLYRCLILFSMILFSFSSCKKETEKQNVKEVSDSAFIQNHLPPLVHKFCKDSLTVNDLNKIFRGKIVVGVGMDNRAWIEFYRNDSEKSICATISITNDTTLKSFWIIFPDSTLTLDDASQLLGSYKKERIPRKASTFFTFKCCENCSDKREIVAEKILNGSIRRFIFLAR